MRVGDIFRYGRPYREDLCIIDGLPNYFNQVSTKGAKLALLDRGINAIASLNSNNGRRPALLLRSSPHKIGSVETPWQDIFDPDRGHIRYFGDNKVCSPVRDPVNATGNKVMLQQFELHTSTDRNVRLRAAPVVCFRTIRQEGRSKGYIQFQGFGIIERAERITQYDRKKRCPFTNYVFDIAVFGLTKENEIFDWSWISARRNDTIFNKECLKLAPESWKTWVTEGATALSKCRRRVVSLFTYSTSEQQPAKKSKEEKALKEVYVFFEKRKHRFEALAAYVASRVLSGDGHAYRHGWITSSGSDGGADFIGRLDVGSGLAGTKIIVLGQAKCEKPETATGGNHIARTVARLRRGWIGVYVTTSYFSEPVQREVLEDKYPIVLVNGKRLAEEVLLATHEEGFKSVNEFLVMIDSGYDEKVMQRGPEEILYE